MSKKFLEEAKAFEEKWNKLFPGGIESLYPNPKYRPAVLLESHTLTIPCWCGDVCKGKKRDDENDV